MLSRSGKFYLVVLIASSMVGGVIAAENSNDDLSNVEKVSVDDRLVEVGDQPATIVVETNSKVASKQKGHSVKMIVGGQSTDGIAKEVTLPVED
jgi:hypothetical protein